MQPDGDAAGVTLRQALRPGYCARWHAQPDMAGSECIDAHAARVAKIILRLWPDSSAELLRAALHHDDGEMGLGDVAGPAKRRFPELAALADKIEVENRLALGIARFRLTEWEALALDLADKLAGLMHVLQVRPDLLREAAWQHDLAVLRGKALLAMQVSALRAKKVLNVVDAEFGPAPEGQEFDIPMTDGVRRWRMDAEVARQRRLREVDRGDGRGPGMVFDTGSEVEPSGLHFAAADVVAPELSDAILAHVRAEGRAAMDAARRDVAAAREAVGEDGEDRQKAVERDLAILLRNLNPSRRSELAKGELHEIAKRVRANVR